MLQLKILEYYGIQNKVIALGTLSLTMITIINTLLYLLNDETNIYNNYTLFRLEPFLITSQISTLVVFVFYYLDNNLDSTYWNQYGDKYGNVNESETTHNMFILRKMNSHSSIFQFFVGLYTLSELNENTRLYYASTLFGISHLFMGIISYIWWASNLVCVHKLDHLFMELIVNSVTVLILSIAFPSLELLFIVLNLIYINIRSTEIKRAELVKLSTLLIISTFVPTLVYGSCGDLYTFSLGTIFTLGGLVPKIADYSNNFIYGTALFHFMEAFGFLMFYKWVQTFPFIEND
jgi:hypothetical protein